MASWWTAVQACVWIATRDERLLQSIRSNASLAVADEEVQGALWYDFDSLSTEQARITTVEACDLIVEACSAGRITMFGREKGEGEWTPIPIGEWVHLEIQDKPNVGAIAAPSGVFETVAPWWDQLLLASHEVQRQWPFPRRKNKIWDSRPDTVAEAAWAQRRRRIFRNQAPFPLVLGDDGLPDVLEVSLVEAFSWCAFGFAVPPSLWIDDAVVKVSDDEYAAARKRYADALGNFRHASAAVKGTRRPPNDPTQIEYHVAATIALDAQKAEQTARAKMADQIAIRSYLANVYQVARQERAIPSSDTSFEQRIADETEKKLFNALQRGQLECLGRRNADTPIWEVLPKDYFRLSIGIRLNHNILEPTDKASADECRLILEHVSTWTDLRIDTDKLRSWWRELSSPNLAKDIGATTELPSVSLLKSGSARFVNAERLETLRRIKNAKFDLRKLVRLCEELNSNFASLNYLSTAMLLRAILDHVPPIFGVRNFNEVESNYSGSKSFKESMQSLNSSSRKIADQHLHQQIRQRESLPNDTQVDFSNAMDVLLSEVERLLSE